MKRVLLTILLGAGLSVLPVYGAICSQTDWLKEPVIAKAAEWEPITDPVRTHEVDVREWWEVEYGNDSDIPDDIEEASIIAGRQHNTAPELYQALADVETNYGANVGHGEYKGAWQVSERWHAGRLADLGLEGSDLSDTYVNCLVAADYLAELGEKYEGDIYLVLMAYNGDSAGMRRYYQTGKPSKYADKVLAKSEELERRHNK